MILGFMIIKNGWISFEHYFENFMQYIHSKRDFFEFVDDTSYDIGDYEFGNAVFEIIDTGEINVGIVSLKDKQIPDERKSQLIDIAKSVAVADKDITHRVLKSLYATDLIY